MRRDIAVPLLTIGSGLTGADMKKTIELRLCEQMHDLMELARKAPNEKCREKIMDAYYALEKAAEATLEKPEPFWHGKFVNRGKGRLR